MDRTAYIATIQVLINASSEGTAVDAMIGLLSELPDNGIIDWQYLSINGYRFTPKPISIVEAESYVEGSGFRADPCPWCEGPMNAEGWCPYCDPSTREGHPR